MTIDPSVERAQQVRLLDAARQAATRAYAPYSRFRVGAAALFGDVISVGCNVENASYGLTLCAERIAIFNGISVGGTALRALAVTCPDAPPDARDQRMSCGACRQVIREFATEDFLLLVDGVGAFRIDELLPDPFRLRRRSSR